jgi:hypothetical protein
MAPGGAIAAFRRRDGRLDGAVSAFPLAQASLSR